MHRDLCEAAGKTNITVQKRDRSKRGSRKESDREREREREIGREREGTKVVDV